MEDPFMDDDSDDEIFRTIDTTQQMPDFCDTAASSTGKVGPSAASSKGSPAVRGGSIDQSWMDNSLPSSTASSSTPFRARPASTTTTGIKYASFAAMNASSYLDANEDNQQKKTNKKNGRVLYVAPTGKAAAVMRKRAKPQNAFTIHQVIFSHRAWSQKEGGGGGGGEEWKFCKTQIVAVDESSMVSLELFSHLLSALRKSSRLRKIVLLGDVLQLPSIEPGNMMEDMFKAFRIKGWTVELKTNHRSEGSLIFDNAHRISQQQPPVFDKNGGFELLTPSAGEEGGFSQPQLLAGTGMQSLPRVNQNTLRALLEDIQKQHKPKKGRSSMAKEKQELYLSLITNKKRQIEFGIDDDSKSQFIAFTNQECLVVNELCCYEYQNHRTREEKPEAPGKKQLLIIKGDKIMCTKNNDVPSCGFTDPVTGQFVGELPTQLQLETGTAACDASSQLPDVDREMTEQNFRYMNGNVYKVEETSEQVSVEKEDTEDDPPDDGARKPTKMRTKNCMKLDDLAGETMRPNEKLFKKLCHPRHAWALTIHKFQGSETDVVVYGVSSLKTETWKHVYTAVTRGKKRVVIVGKPDDLMDAISRKPRIRQTTLGEKMEQVTKKTDKAMIDKKVEAQPRPPCLRRKRVDDVIRNSCDVIQDDSFDVQLSQIADQEFEALQRTPKKMKEEEEDCGADDVMEPVNLWASPPRASDVTAATTSAAAPNAGFVSPLSKSLSNQLNFFDDDDEDDDFIDL